MDLVHVLVITLVTVFGVAGPVFAAANLIVVTRRLRKDEAVEAATFLALRQLEEWLKSTRQPSSGSR